MLNLYDILLEQMDYDRLIEEGRDPVEVLHHKYNYIPSEIIDKVISIDPTKKKSYSQWLLGKWDDESDFIRRCLRNGKIEKLFNYFKARNDIQLRAFPSVKECVRDFIPEEDTVLSKSKEPKTYVMNLDQEVSSDLANDFDIVYEDNDWIIAVPNTYEAECKLGENMKWCTANCYGDGRSYYNRYLNDYGGKYYVNFNLNEEESSNGKDYPYTRYQFHFESKQLMDKNDNQVNPLEIGMPDGAVEFYSSEGYNLDSEDYVDLEERREQYDNQRYNDGYSLCDDPPLWILQEFNDDYVMFGDDARYYVYDIENDEADPISWNEVYNPNRTENSIIYQGDKLYILKDKEREQTVMLVIYEENARERRGWGSRDWQYYDIKPNYIHLGDDIGVFGVSKDCTGYRDSNEFYYTFMSRESGEFMFKQIDASKCESMFINEACTNADEWERTFIETTDGQYHSLFVLWSDQTGADMECIVRRDTPKNGKSFFINEEGYVEGDFRNYKVYWDDNAEQEQEMDIHLFYRLKSGEYVVTADKTDERGRKKQVYNILFEKNGKPLLDEWQYKFLGKFFNIYAFENEDEGKALFNKNGEQIWNWFETMRGDKVNGFVFAKLGNGNSEKFAVIDANNGIVTQVFYKGTSINTEHHQIVVYDTDKMNGKIFDYLENKYVHEELTNVLMLTQHFPNILYCKYANSNEHVLFDLDSQKNIATNIAEIQWERYISNYINIIYTDSKVNVMDIRTQELCLPANTNKIVFFDYYQGDVAVFESNGKYFVSAPNKKVLLNPKGSEVPLKFDHSYVEATDGNVTILLYVQTQDMKLHLSKYWDGTMSYASGRYYDERDKEKAAPPEVAQLFKRVTGEDLPNQQGQQTTNEVKETFWKTLNKINESIRNKQ